MVIQNARKKGPIDAPPGSERLTARQIETAKQRRREGASIGDIANAMGISKETVHRHVRGIKPTSPNDGAAVEEQPVRPFVPQNNGGETPPVETPKHTKFAVEIDLDPQLVLLLAGDAARLGYTSVTEYIRQYNIPWVAAIAEGAELLDVKTPGDYKTKLMEVCKGYIAYREMLKKAQMEVGKDIGASERQQNQPSQKN